jgi:predicted phage-related endonuclease
MNNETKENIMNNMTLAVVRNIAYSQINKINKNIKEIVEVDKELLNSIDINMKNAINKIINNYKLKNQPWK